MKKAIFHSSFNPIHMSHIVVINAAMSVYDELVILVTSDDNEHYPVDINTRSKLVEKAIEPINKGNLKVIKLEVGKTPSQYAKENEINVVVRGLRQREITDKESRVAEDYTDKNDDIEFHYFVIEDSKISSKMIKEKIKNGDDIKGIVPEHIRREIEAEWKRVS